MTGTCLQEKRRRTRTSSGRDSLLARTVRSGAGARQATAWHGKAISKREVVKGGRCEVSRFCIAEKYWSQCLTLHLAIGQFTGGREGRFQEPFVPRLR